MSHSTGLSIITTMNNCITQLILRKTAASYTVVFTILINEFIFLLLYGPSSPDELDFFN
jgi:hypothetical protein